jgi:uncharacterized protein (TIGR02172 family)
MHITASRSGRRLTVALEGRLDITTAAEVEATLSLDDVDTLVFDLDACSYVSSAGLRVFLTAYRTLNARGGRAELVNVSREVREVLEVTGLSRLVTMRPRPREISIEGLERLSAGFCGECYRLDRESVVKLYNEGIGAELAEQEKEFARAAFVAGIPTAISYDLVRSGNRTGVIYEMLDADTLTQIIRRDLAEMDRHARMLADVAHAIHAVEGDPAIFPDLKPKLREAIAATGEYLAADDVALLQQCLDRVPDADTCVHFDLHTNNIMVRAGEPLIIDMGDLSRGSYLFDVGLICGIYAFEDTGTCEVVTKIPNSKGVALWDAFVRHYFAGRPAEDLAFFLEHQLFFAALRLVFSSRFLPNLRETAQQFLTTRTLPALRARAG